MASFIGIKLADGNFYPILNEKAAQRKRLVLTTVTDNQSGVQIDLYRSPAKTMTNARYIGTLVLENLPPKKKGEPSIEMVIDYSADGEISASAVDLDKNSAGERQILTVSLTSLDETDGKEYDLVEGVLESGDEHSDIPPFDYETPKKPVFMIIVITALILIVAGFAVWFFLFNGKAAFGFSKPEKQAVQAAPQTKQAPARTPPSPPPPPPPPEPEVPAMAAESTAGAASPEAAAAPATPPPPPAAPPSPPPQTTSGQTASGTSGEGRNRPPAQTGRADRSRSVPPVSSYNIPYPIPKDGVWYTIRWGDTLWAISEAFYRNPWDYRFLARYNGIKNPALIISGNRIKIPPRR